MKSTARVLLLPWFALLLLSCNASNSPEAEIRAYIAAAVEAAEARDSGELAAMIHGDYQDAKGYNKKRLGGLLRAYFFRHRNIHLFSKIGDIELLADNQAQVRLHVAMAGSVIADVGALSALRARIYAFELTLIKQEDWMLRQASWRPASVDDLQ